MAGTGRFRIPGAKALHTKKRQLPYSSCKGKLIPEPPAQPTPPRSLQTLDTGHFTHIISCNPYDAESVRRQRGLLSYVTDKEAKA